MTDNPPVPGDDQNPSTPVPATDDDARKARNDALFGDLDDEETPEDIKAERDALRQTLANMGTSLGRSQQDNLTLTKALATQKEESAAVLGRTKQQFEEQKPFMLEKFLKDVLPVVDNLERGLAAVTADQRASDPKLDKYLQGMEKTLGQLTAVFNKFGIKAIDPKGEDFDPNKHEAISMVDDPDAESDTVISVAQKGYELNGRIIRPAKVTVKP